MSNGNGRGPTGNADWDVKKHSVTVGDVGAKDRPVWQFVLGGQPLGGKNDLPPFWHQRRDVFLRGSIYRESMWASAVHIAITKAASQGWELRGEQKRTVARWQELLLACDGNQSWVSFMQKQLMDYCCTGNGQFFEIVRQSNARGSRIIGLMHLDSLRMTRTGDPIVPYLYRDRLNRLHEIKYYQALSLSDMPDPSEMWYGVGHCAAERAWPAIRKLSAIETYIYEKVSGRRSLAVHIVGGMSETSYLSAVTASEQEASQKGAVIYMGATVIPVMGDVAPTLVTIPLASLPDNFNRKEEFDICVLQYADALGIDVQDLQPLTGRSLGTGAQSRVLDDKARGKGLITWRQQFQHMMNQNITPESVTFYFKERDQTEEARTADLESKRAATVGAMVQQGLLIPQQGQQLLVQWDVVPKELFPQYDLNDKTLADDEKPSPDPTVEQMQQALAQAEQLRMQAAAQQKLQPGMGGQYGQPSAPAGGAGYFPPGGGFGGGMTLQETRQPATGEVLTKDDLIDALRVVLKETRRSRKRGKAEKAALAEKERQPAQYTFNMPPIIAPITVDMPRQDPPVVNNYLPAAAAPEIHNHLPASEIHNHVPQQAAPIVANTVNLPETRISVQSAMPDIIVQPSLSPSPVIHNHMPDAPAPQVSVVNQVPQAAPSTVTVNVPEAAAPVINNLIQQSDAGMTVETIEVTERESNGLLKRLRKITERKPRA